MKITRKNREERKKAGQGRNSPIKDKIAWAENLFDRVGDTILKDTVAADLLFRLDGAISHSHAAMTETGISLLCNECERIEGGSCCGSGLENRYDGWLLLINRLLGHDLPKERYDQGSCFFLGELGCRLKARHVICVNYLCKKITDRIDHQKIKVLREKEGEELTLLFLLNERLKKMLKEL